MEGLVLLTDLYDLVKGFMPLTEGLHLVLTDGRISFSTL